MHRNWRKFDLSASTKTRGGDVWEVRWSDAVGGPPIEAPLSSTAWCASGHVPSSSQLAPMTPRASFLGTHLSGTAARRPWNWAERWTRRATPRPRRRLRWTIRRAAPPRPFLRLGVRLDDAARVGDGGAADVEGLLHRFPLEERKVELVGERARRLVVRALAGLVGREERGRRQNCNEERERARVELRQLERRLGAVGAVCVLGAVRF